MITKTERFKEACKKILSAVDTDASLKGVIYGYDTLEIDAHGGEARMNVTNGEYYVSVLFDQVEGEEFRAVVDAKKFLMLISKVTTEEIGLDVVGNALSVTANGSYKFPMKIADSELVRLPRLDLGEEAVSFSISTDKLVSMLNFNGKEFANGTMSRPLQKFYYLDGEGCITWTNSSACVNSFPLSKQVSMLLNQKAVKLFKLFNSDDVTVTLGHADVNGGPQTRIRLDSPDVTVYSIVTSDEALIDSVPVKSIRGTANATYPYSATIRASEMLEAIDRILLFSDSSSASKGVCVFEFGTEGFRIYDSRKQNVEKVKYHDTVLPESVNGFSMNLSVYGIKHILENSDEQFVKLNFGDERVVVLANGCVRNVISKRTI